MLTEHKWTHYLYIVRFSDGKYYTGVAKRRHKNPYEDDYYGSPVTNKEKWKQETPEKEVIAYLFVENNIDAYSIEKDWQRKNFDIKDPNCLNAHFGNTHFSTAAAVRGGSIVGRRHVKSGHLDRIRAASNEKKRRRAVLVTDMESGEEIVYHSVGEAAKALNKHSSTLSNVLSGRRSPCWPFKIRYA
jgi:predicted GIY-YIG superfamily endonuclease